MCKHVALNFLVVNFIVKTHDIWEGDMTTRSEIENIHSLGFWDIRAGVTSRRLTLRGLELDVFLCGLVKIDMVDLLKKGIPTFVAMKGGTLSADSAIR